MILLSLFGIYSTASAAPLESAEFYNTAHTLNKGNKVIHPFYPSMFGVSDKVDLKTSFIGWFAGINLTTEVGLMNSDSSALSVDILSDAAYGGGYSAGAVLNYTSGGVLSNRFNASFGGVQTSTLVPKNLDLEGSDTEYVQVDFLSMPLSLGYDLVSSDDTTIKFEGATDVGAFISDVAPSGSLSATWNKGWESFRLRLGLTAYYLSIDEQTQTALNQVGVTLPSFVPLPSMQLWWFK